MGGRKVPYISSMVHKVPKYAQNVDFYDNIPENTSNIPINFGSNIPRAYPAYSAGGKWWVGCQKNLVFSFFKSLSLGVSNVQSILLHVALLLQINLQTTHQQVI